MARVVLGFLIVAAIAAVAYVSWNYKVDAQYADGQLASVRLTRRGATAPASESSFEGETPPRAERSTFRLASFHVDRLDERKLANRRVSAVLQWLGTRFELLALQGLRGPNLSVAARLSEQLSAAAGRPYDFAAVLPRSAQPGEEYSAFFFDRTALEVDRNTVAVVADPAGKFRHPPLVSLFRARGPKPQEAFTFQLVSVAIDTDRAAEESPLLADVYRAVRDDGRGEDDVLLVGSLGLEESEIPSLQHVLDLTAAIVAAPTTVRGTRRIDNILFQRRVTSEFTGRADVVDLLRAMQLDFAAASEVSEHLPIWAEFSVYEGGQPGHLVGAPLK